MSRRLAALSVATTALLLALLAGGASAAAPVRPRASLPQIEPQVMCVTCKIPLNVAQSPQADRERVYIQSLIDRGYDEGQIKRALVGQYGPAVLGLPSAHGFNLAAYLVPIAVLLALIAVLAALLPRWRRRARPPTEQGRETAVEALSAADAARLESDLARFD